LNDSELIGWSKVTTGHYLTRDGNRIDGKGLVPDFPVEDYELVNGIDVQAINLLVSSGTIELNGVGNDVFSAEKILRAKGFELDNPDSVLDAQTCEFLKQFQQENDIAITGVLDDPTKQALNLELDILRKTVDKQYAKAIELLSLLKY
jgi:carboxyl-terminal processing protease